MSRRVLVVMAILTLLGAVAFFAYMAFGAVVCGATGSSCGGFARQGNIVLICGGLAATILFALALRRPRQLVIPEDDERPGSGGPYR